MELKDVTFRSRPYLNWVKKQPSALSGLPADDPHHLIGYNRQGVKCSDFLTFPLTRLEHTRFHDMGRRSWEDQHGSQWRYVALTLEKAIREGVFKEWEVG